MLTFKANGSYRNSKGTKVFRSIVSGNADELAAYRAAQGTFLRETPDGKPLFFSTRYAGESGNLIITSTGKVVADMSKFDAAASLTAQYGGNFGEAIAQGMVANLLGGASAPAATSAAPVAEEAETEEETDLDQH